MYFLKLLQSLEVVRERREVGEGEGLGSQECSFQYAKSLTDAMVPRGIFADQSHALQKTEPLSSHSPSLDL